MSGSTRFSVDGDTVTDSETGLVWPRLAQVAETGLSWAEAFDFIRGMNERRAFGFSDWRLPNRRELYSLIDHGQREPALPDGHPFEHVWSGKVWSSTSSARDRAYAWWVQFSGGRMFFGRKADDCVVWPVRGESTALFATGQRTCHGWDGEEIPCAGSGQDGELRYGRAWPEPRFEDLGDGVLDRLSGLVWARDTDLTGGMTDFATALQAVARLAGESGKGWRLPGIRELESLTDCEHADPALPSGHPFTSVREEYWSSTDSGFDPEWAFCLYLHKGAVGVGFKVRPEFHVWPVRPA